MPRQLPPLNSVRAFEVAARHLNFSRAAEEAGVTPGAISKQILLLEDFIGHKLFERLPGGLSLTHEGVQLKNSVAPAFDMLDRAFIRYSRRSPRSNVCRISTVASFAGQFLVPRLDRFKEKCPHIELEILTSIRLVDFAREEIDIGVRYGGGGWDDVAYTPLLKGELAAVCSPDLLEKRGDKSLQEFMETTRRIQVFSNDEWRVWAKQHDIDLSRAPSAFIIEDSNVAIAAAVAGQGLALVPEILTRRIRRFGKLVTFCEQNLDWDQTHYITHRNNADCSDMIKDVIEWLREEVAMS